MCIQVGKLDKCIGVVSADQESLLVFWKNCYKERIQHRHWGTWRVGHRKQKNGTGEQQEDWVHGPPTKDWEYETSLGQRRHRKILSRLLLFPVHVMWRKRPISNGDYVPCWHEPVQMDVKITTSDRQVNRKSSGACKRNRHVNMYWNVWVSIEIKRVCVWVKCSLAKDSQHNCEALQCKVTINCSSLLSCIKLQQMPMPKTISWHLYNQLTDFRL